MSSRLIVALLILGACTDLPAFEADTCGNFALELGEDCDENNERCVDCKRKCELMFAVPETGPEDPAPPVPEPPCPTGYMCGVDQFCHAPSGAFTAQGKISPFRARDLAITKVDTDGIGDVLGVGTNAISVQLGDETGELTSLGSILAPQARGFSAFVELDNNDSLDLLLPTADGIAAYSSPGGYVAPHSFAFDLTYVQGCPYSLEDNLPFDVFSLNDRYIGVLTVHKTTKFLGMAVVDTTLKVVCPTQLDLLCTDLPVGDPRMSSPSVDVYKTWAPGKVIAVRAAGGLCVVHAREKDLQAPVADPPFTFTDITPSRSLSGRPVLADISDTGCPSLIVMGQNPVAPMREYLGSNVGGDCDLATTFSTFPNTFGDATAIGHVELAPLKAGYGKDALVMSSGVFAVSEPRATTPPKLPVVLMYQSDRPLMAVQSGDIDRDGDLDAVAISATISGGAEDIDVLARTTMGEFLLRRIDTDEPIANFVVGDYDGDEVADIAFTERFAELTERLSVVFGTRDLPLPPTVFGTYSYIVGLCPIQVDDSLDRQNVITDLLVLDIVGGDQAGPIQLSSPAFTVLHGSPQRTLQSFIDPRTDPNPPIPSVFAGVAAGNFFGSTSIDVMAFEFTPGLTAKVWPMSGTRYGQLESTLVAGYPTGIVDCTGVSANGAASFCGDNAHYIAWPIAAPNAMGELVEHDVVIGVDDIGKLPAGTPASPSTAPPRRVMVIDPQKFESGGSFPGQTYASLNALSGMADPVDATFHVQSLVRVDLDGNGDPLLAISFRGGELGQPVTGDVRLCTVDDRGNLMSCPSISIEIAELADWTCVDIAAAQLAPQGRHLPAPAGTDLAVLCHGKEDVGRPTSVFRVWFDRLTNKRTATPLLNYGESPATRILVGDLTGDLLDDLVVLLPALGTTFLAVFPQCEASDLGCLYPQCPPGDLQCVRDIINGVIKDDGSGSVGSK